MCATDVMLPTGTHVKVADASSTFFIFGNDLILFPDLPYFHKCLFLKANSNIFHVSNFSFYEVDIFPSVLLPINY